MKMSHDSVVGYPVINMWQNGFIYLGTLERDIKKTSTTKPIERHHYFHFESYYSIILKPQ